ncbi:NAC domain-containing protein 68-like [Wolffia australiana]
MELRSIESRLPPGFRFHPSDSELVFQYLCKKVANETIFGATLVDVNLHDVEPWELPEEARLNTNEWYFFSFRERRYTTGSRANRATKKGYWKATGKDRPVHQPLTGDVAGMRKTLVYYGGRAPSGLKTSWVMHEFRLDASGVAPGGNWVLCRVFNKDKEETSRESSCQGVHGDGLSYLHCLSGHAERVGCASQLTVYSSLMGFSPEMEVTEEGPPLLGNSGGGEFEFLLDVKEFIDLGWGSQP